MVLPTLLPPVWPAIVWVSVCGCVFARVWHVIECVRVTFPGIVQQFPLAWVLFGFLAAF